MPQGPTIFIQSKWCLWIAGTKIRLVNSWVELDLVRAAGHIVIYLSNSCTGLVHVSTLHRQIFCLDFVYRLKTDTHAFTIKYIDLKIDNKKWSQSGSDLLSRLKQVWSMSRASIFRLRSSLNFSCTCATRRNTISTLHIAHIVLVGQHVSLLLDLKIIMNPCACNCTCPIRRSVPCMSSWC